MPLTTVQLANLAGHPYLRDQSIYLSNHHMYGSSRLGISQYLSSQYKYRYNYEFGMVDTFGMTAPRPLCSGMLKLSGFMEKRTISFLHEALASVMPEHGTATS